MLLAGIVSEKERDIEQKAKRLVVHIGMPKTGTSALRHLLADNADYLASHDILVPMPMADKKAWHRRFARELAGRSEEGSATGYCERMSHAIGGSGATTAILSAETFSTLGPSSDVANRLADFAQSIGRRVTIIIFLRRQQDYAESLYVQRVKTGYLNSDFETFVEENLGKPVFDYTKLLAPWETAFDDIVVRKFVPENIATDFFDATGLHVSPEQLPAPIGRYNLRMTARTVEQLRFCTSLLEKEGVGRFERGKLLARVMEVLPDSHGPAFHALTPQLSERIRRTCDDTNDEIARRYFDSPPLFPDTGPLPEPTVVRIDDPQEQARLTDLVARLHGP
ncbi:hypothetical protein [Parasphingopyxis sp.]|uniref:hypothetical protein n=1 Tax=Parasphingopyxis sp. TaxID=1920299 RepID=UPI002624FC28|nr:hypothetical protein [Parasphingopyxis sp.]